VIVDDNSVSSRLWTSSSRWCAE